MTYLPCVEIENVPAAPATASVIWLHGLGADGHDFVPLVPELRLPDSLPVRFVFPHAPQIPVTINNGYVMPAWYDILEMNLDQRIDEIQLNKNALAVQDLVRREMDRGVPPERIILAGFSQGGAVVYQAGYTFNQPLGGLLVLSSYFATHKTINVHPANKQTPVLVQHGTLDSVVAPLLGESAVESIKKFGGNVIHQTYPMAHTLCPDQVVDISRWLQERLA